MPTTAATSSSDSATTTTTTRSAALIVVDMSVEQVRGVSYNKDALIANCARLLRAEEEGPKKLFELKIDSRLWLKHPSESSLSWVWPGSGVDLFKAGSEGASLIPELRRRRQRQRNRDSSNDDDDDDDVIFVKKKNYSCFAQSDLLELLRRRGITEVYVAGINTDYCVFATAMDAFANFLRVYVVEDAVSSCRGREAHAEGLRNVRRHFGPDALVTTEQVLQRLSRRRSPPRPGP